VLFVNTRRFDQASEAHRRAIAIREKLAAEYPVLPYYQLGLARSYCDMGALTYTLGNSKESVDWFGKSIGIANQIYEQNKGRLQARHFLRDALMDRAYAHDDLNMHAEAMKDFNRAIELSQQSELPQFRIAHAYFRLLSGQVTEVTAELPELRKQLGQSADDLYNFAILYSVASSKVAAKKLEYANTSMDLLQKAVVAGFDNITFLKTTPALHPLRDRDDFRKLLADLEAKFPPKREVLPPPRPQK
jgi:tetratricopeptide (TPR) repeat protein